MSGSPVDHTASDRELADILALARKCNTRVFVKGTDDRPVIQLRCKVSRREVGGSELKRRIKEVLSKDEDDEKA